jgi:hypothetical protein
MISKMWSVGLATAVLFGALAVSPGPVVAGEFAREHPRRAQVNQRARRQQGRIAAGIAHGRLSAGQAARLEAREAAIKRQEHRDVRANGGYLTKRQQRHLNREENAASRAIYRAKHPANG